MKRCVSHGPHGLCSVRVDQKYVQTSSISYNSPHQIIYYRELVTLCVSLAPPLKLVTVFHHLPQVG